MWDVGLGDGILRRIGRRGRNAVGSSRAGICLLDGLYSSE